MCVASVEDYCVVGHWRVDVQCHDLCIHDSNHEDIRTEYVVGIGLISKPDPSSELGINCPGIWNSYSVCGRFRVVGLGNNTGSNCMRFGFI